MSGKRKRGLGTEDKKDISEIKLISKPAALPNPKIMRKKPWMRIKHQNEQSWVQEGDKYYKNYYNRISSDKNYDFNDKKT